MRAFAARRLKLASRRSASSIARRRPSSARASALSLRDLASSISFRRCFLTLLSTTTLCGAIGSATIASDIFSGGRSVRAASRS